MACQQINKPPSHFEENYKKVEVIGSGSFGTVYKCSSKKTGNFFAIKVTDFSGEALQEVKIIHDLPSHVNVVQYFNFWNDELPPQHRYSESSSLQNSSIVSVLCIPMELCSGHLRNWIENQTEITEQMHSAACTQLISGLEHIHRHNIIHRDLKLENVLVGLDNSTMKIGDFGLSTAKADVLSHTPGVGNQLYRAPEQEGDRYEASVDIYAMGLIFFELAWPQIQPAKNGGNKEVFRSTLRELKTERMFPPGFEEKWSRQAQLVREMIENCPRRRPNSNQIKIYLEERKDWSHNANENTPESRKVEKHPLFNSEKRDFQCDCSSCRGHNLPNKENENPLLEKIPNQCWNVLNPVPHFVGRETELIELTNFVTDKRDKIIVISGMGGQGKTQLCRKWISQMKEKEKCLRIIWLQGESASSLSCSLNNFATFTDPELAESMEKGFYKLTEEVVSLLKDEKKVVWVIDNVDTEYKELETMATIILTRTENSRIIITTRLRILLTENAQYLALQTLSPEAAHEFIKNGINGNLLDEDVEMLCKKMGYHALALQLSIGFIRSNRICTAGGNEFSIKDFLILFKSNKKLFLEKTEKLAEYGKNVFHHIKQFVTLLRNRKQNIAQDVLLILSLFRHEGVEMDFLLETSSMVSTQKKPSIWTAFLKNVSKSKNRKSAADQLKEAVDLLHSLSLVDAASVQTITIHPLIQETMRLLFHSEWIEVADSIFKETKIRNLSKKRLSHILRLWEIGSREDILLRKHAFLMEDIYESLYQTLQIQALVPFTVSNRENVLRAFENCRSRREVITAERYYGMAHFQSGDYEKGLHILEALQSTARRFLGNSDLDTINVEVDLADALMRFNRAEEAVLLYESILPRCISIHGENHEETIMIKHNNAQAQLYCSRYDEALKAFEEVLQWRVRNLGTQHPSTLNTRHSIACCHFVTNDLEKAGPDFHAILELKKNVLGEKHPETIITWGWVAQTFFEMGDYKKSRLECERIIEDSKEVLGLDHLRTLIFRHNHAFCLLKLGEIENAIIELEDILELVTQKLGQNHPCVNKTKSLLLEAQNNGKENKPQK